MGFNLPAQSSQPIADFSVSSTQVCFGESVTFSDLSTSYPNSWNWDFGDGNSSTLQTPPIPILIQEIIQLL